jgi:ribonuclease HI
MATSGRLRDLFDDSPTPHIAHPPRTHHRDYYLATDGSFVGGRGGLGAIVETGEGERLLRLARVADSPDNNAAEYRALRLGLDALAARAESGASVGVLVDHDDLAANVNAAVLASRDPTRKPPHRVSIPSATTNHWRGIQARINGFGAIRAARIESDRNPAHPLANAPDEYAHVNDEPDRCVLPAPGVSDEQVPPPSRSDRRASD